MFEKFLKLSFQLAFVVLVVSLIFSVATGLYAVWNPLDESESLGRKIATGLIVMLASLFYLAACDAWFRIHSDRGTKD